MFLATIDLKEDKLHFANAAHFPPAALINDNETSFLEQKGKPLGLFADPTFTSLTVDFPQGARLVGVLGWRPGSGAQGRSAGQRNLSGESHGGSFGHG